MEINSLMSCSVRNGNQTQYLEGNVTHSNLISLFILGHTLSHVTVINEASNNSAWVCFKK